MKIKVRFSFLLFNALIFMFRDAELILVFYIACISHEIGHITALKLVGGKLESVEFSGTGIKICATPCFSLRDGIFVLLSGPAVNLIMSAVLNVLHTGSLLSAFSLAEGLFNLLPYSMLDGGAVLNLIAEGSTCENQIRIVYSVIRIVFLIVIIIIMLNVYIL